MMKSWQRVAGGLAMLAALGSVQAQASGSVGQRLVVGYITPAMQAFQQAAQTLHGDLETFCANEAAVTGKADSAPKQKLRQDFESLVDAWAGIAFLRFGPLVEGNRFERIFFWPDARGVMQRQVSSLLAGDSIPDAQSLPQHSIAVQGLPALEYVLYRDKGLLSDGAEAQPAKSCQYAVSVSGNLAELGTQLAQAWKADANYAREFASPAASNHIYRNDNEVATEVLKALAGGLRFEGDVKLQSAAGAKNAQAQWRALPFGRSYLATDALKASLQGMQRFHEVAAFQQEPAWLKQALNDEIGRAVVVLTPLRASANDDSAFASVQNELKLAQLITGNARRLVDEDLAASVGVGLGFNALDGD